MSIFVWPDEDGRKEGDTEGSVSVFQCQLFDVVLVCVVEKPEFSLSHR